MNYQGLYHPCCGYLFQLRLEAYLSSWLGAVTLVQRLRLWFELLERSGDSAQKACSPEVHAMSAIAPVKMEKSPDHPTVKRVDPSDLSRRQIPLPVPRDGARQYPAKSRAAIRQIALASVAAL